MWALYTVQYTLLYTYLKHQRLIFPNLSMKKWHSSPCQNSTAVMHSVHSTSTHLWSMWHKIGCIYTNLISRIFKPWKCRVWENDVLHWQLAQIVGDRIWKVEKIFFCSSLNTRILYIARKLFIRHFVDKASLISNKQSSSVKHRFLKNCVSVVLIRRFFMHCFKGEV
jgi:hypothetical protein